jgi:hypothetical protein
MGSPTARRPLASRTAALVTATLVTTALAYLPAACGDEPEPGRPFDGHGRGDAVYADVVVDALAAAPAQAALAVNGVRGAGPGAGGTDVLSLGYDPDRDASVTLRWSGRRVTNGPGPDFVVFENAFAIGSGGGVFMDPAIVELSRDGVRWVPFPHDYLAPDETVYSDDPADWRGFAGLRPVLLHEEHNPVDPFDSAAAGGDPFDLDALPADGGEADAIRAHGFVFLRLTTAPSRVNPDTGAPYVRDPVANGADIDGVYARYLEEE